LPNPRISEELTRKVGGRFQLSALIQKRLQELNSGSRPLVEPKKGEGSFEIVVREILENKIYLEEAEEG